MISVGGVESWHELVVITVTMKVLVSRVLLLAVLRSVTVMVSV